MMVEDRNVESFYIRSRGLIPASSDGISPSEAVILLHILHIAILQG